jgi:hypothetical protein
VPQVEVSRTGWSLTGYTWTITFVTPRNDLPMLALDPINLGGPNVTNVVVSSLFNGSSSSLFFEPIPSWMTEVPLSWVATEDIRSNVEVYRKTASGDELKAVCDSTGEKPSGLWGLFKGDEMSCSYSYSESATPIITNYSIVSYVDRSTSEISITGSKFLIGSPAGPTAAKVKVFIANQICNVTFLVDDYIVCRVSNVPWGLHRVSVNIEGYGEAISTTPSQLFFKEALYSISPLAGSVTGGQILTIEGRGFRNDHSLSWDSSL